VERSKLFNYISKLIKFLPINTRYKPSFLNSILLLAPLNPIPSENVGSNIRDRILAQVEEKLLPSNLLKYVT